MSIRDHVRDIVRKIISRSSGVERFTNSSDYWERRYLHGGNSGVGSYGKFADFKAEVLNNFVAEHRVGSVIEFGCGDGNQLSLSDYPEYIGLDVSHIAVGKCRNQFDNDPSKRFMILSEYAGERADISLSIDVIYHLVEDHLFDSHMRLLFGAAKRFVAIYASNSDTPGPTLDLHVRQRHFQRWIDHEQPAWRLIQNIPNRFPYQGDYRTGSWSEFFFFARSNQE